MATKPRTNRSPYMMSANLGSGARTTTGGTYENPRLGIQDYTAFSRGVASTLKAPTPEEEAELKLTDIGAWDPDVNEHYIDEHGVAHDLNDDAFTLANARWLNNFVEGQKQKFRTSNKRNQAAIQADMNQYKDLNNMGLTLEAAADKTTDAGIRVFLPGVNGEKTSVSLASLARITNENPNALEVASRNNKAGIPQKGYILNTGDEEIFINASAMNASWRQDNFAIKYNEDATLNDALKVRGAGYTTQFQKVGTTYFDEQNDKNYQVGVSDKYVQNESIARYTKDANLHANEYFSPGSFTDETFASAWNQLRNIVGNGNFAFSDELQAKVEQAGGINGEGMNNALRTELLRDYTAERYKLKNGDAFIVSEGNDGFAVGRAIPKTYTNRQYWDADYKKSEQKPDSDGDGGGGSGISKPDRSRIDRFFRLFNKGLEVQTFGENVSVEGKPGFVINESAIENFFQEYQLPIGGADRKVGGIEYFPDRYGKGGMPGDAGLGTLKVMWVKSGDDDVADEEITYDLNDEGSVLKLVSKMKKVGGSPELTPSVVTGIVNEFQRLKDVIKGGSLRDPSDIPPMAPENQ